MKQCINCGAVLPEGEQSVCLVCGTRQAQPLAQTALPVTPAARDTIHRSAAYPPQPHASAPPRAAADGAQKAALGRTSHAAPPSGRGRSATARAGAQDGNRTELYGSSAPSAADGVRRKPSRRKQDGLLRILALVLAALMVLLLAGAGLTYFMYENFNVADAYSSLSAALLKADVPALRELVSGNDVTVTDEGLAALCRAFSTQENVDRLLAQLKQQTAGAAGEFPYPSLAPISDPVFLGYKNHRLLAQPVSLHIVTIAQNILLSLDGTARTGEPIEGGAVYKALFPGVYTCTVTGQTALGETFSGAPTDLALFDPVTPVVFDGALPIANISVSGCLSDDAIIAINGTDVPQKPLDRVVSLPQVSVGSTISMRYTTAYGAATTASVQFTDRAQAQLAFSGHATEGGVPSQDDLKALFGGFYASYLDALNSADAARITACTEAMRSKLAGDVGKDEVKANVYQFTEAQVNMTPVEQAFLEDGTPTLKLNALCTYKTTKRSGNASDKSKKDDATDDKKETPHTVYYAVELTYVDGGWKVNRLAETTQENFDGGVLVPLEG